MITDQYRFFLYILISSICFIYLYAYSIMPLRLKTRYAALTNIELIA